MTTRAIECISRQTARRYLLGRQGLWPGRRWSGKSGAAEAIRTLGSVQVDPLNVAGRNHDLVLWSRVIDHDPAHLDALLYQDRQFFDYGALLFIYPIEELAYWQLHMRRRALTGRQPQIAAEHADLIDEVRAELRGRGPLGNRDFAGYARVDSYRARKDTGLALWYLWITGELMTHGRRNFERLYGFRDQIAPDIAERSEQEIEAYFARKALTGPGLVTASEWAKTLAYYLHAGLDRAERQRRLEALVDEGTAVRVRVEGIREPCYMPAADRAIVDALDAGQCSEAWQPLDTTTEDEVTFVAPLDNVLNRGRTKALFDFEYIWEVYKPAHLRRWGYYTLPVLWGDRLVARLDPKLDRRTKTLHVNGFWAEDASLVGDEAFVAALARGLQRFARFNGASEIALDGIEPAAFAGAVLAAVGRS